MSVKPSSYAQWDSNGTNVSAVTAGHKTDGYATNEVPTSAEWNAHFKLIGEWTQWLLDGAADATVTSKALSDGSNNDLDLTGTASLAGKTYFNVTHTKTSTDATVTGLANGYDGKEIVLTSYSSTNAWFLALESGSSLTNNRIHSSTLTSGRTIYVPAGASIRLRYVSAISRWVILTNAYCYVQDTVHMSISGIHADPSGTTYGSGVASFTEVNSRRARQGILHAADVQTAVYIPLALDVGTIINGYTLRIKKTSGTGTTIDTNLAGWDATTETMTDQTASALATANPGLTSIEHTCNVTVTTDNFYQVRIRTHDGALAQPTGGGTGDFSYGLKLNVLRPLL